MTDRERFGSAWAREVERRFQQQVLADTRGAWTRQRLENVARENGLAVHWEGEALCFLSSPDGVGGHIVLRLGQPVTEEDEFAIERLQRQAAVHRHA
ncbi:MAG: hypothetical protein NVV74_02800 [Magnetospirillum sp.]|nr:hypothetical protein [Magnetospirillum sp.]